MNNDVVVYFLLFVSFVHIPVVPHAERPIDYDTAPTPIKVNLGNKTDFLVPGCCRIVKL